MADKYIQDFLDAIKMVANNTIKNAKYDTTEKGVIQGNYNAARGSYIALISGAEREVYGDEGYSIGDLVYILNPNGDFSQQLHIIAKEYIGIGNQLENEVEVTDQYVTNGDNQMPLESFTSTIVLLPFAEAQSGSLPKINRQQFLAYLKNSEALIAFLAASSALKNSCFLAPTMAAKIDEGNISTALFKSRTAALQNLLAAAMCSSTSLYVC